MDRTTRPTQQARRQGSPRSSAAGARGSRWRCARSGRGFTLIEVIIVVLIVVAVAALVLPAMNRRSGCSSRDDVADLLDAAVAEARARSARSGAAVSIRLRDQREGKVLVVVADGPAGTAPGAAGEGERPIDTVEDEQVVGVIRQPAAHSQEEDGATMRDETALAVVTPDGTVHPGSQGQVRVGNDGQVCKVRVDSFGGVHLGDRRAATEGDGMDAPADEPTGLASGQDQESTGP